jgi:hypothetical protein
MMRIFLLPFVISGLVLANSLNSQQQYQLHNNLVKSGRSGYVKSETNSQLHHNAHGVRYIPSQIVVNTQPPQKETTQHVLVQQTQPTVTQPQIQPTQSALVPQQRVQQQNAYTGYPHYEKQANMRQFSMPNQNVTKYYTLNLGSGLASSYNYSEGVKSHSLSNNNIVPILNKQGFGGIYRGHKFNTAFNFKFRFEYGGMWEVLSFKEEHTSYSRNIFNHNVAAGVRGFVDIPMNNRLAFTVGADIHYGILSHIIAEDQVFTTGASYGVMAGFSLKYTKSRSLYILLRQGMIPNQNYKILNVSRPANFNSTSIIFGVQLASW